MSQVEGGSAGGADEGAGVAAQEGAAPAATAPESGDGGAGSSLLTRDEAGNAELPGDTPDGKAEGRKEGEADPATLVPAKPEEYSLTFEKDVQVDEGLLNDFKTTAHELGIPQAQAQKLADFYVKHAGEAAKAAGEAQTAALAQARLGWESEITSRPNFREEVVDARRTLQEFGSPELNEIMDSSLLGSHPVFFDFVVKVGKALAEPEARGAGMGGGRQKPLADRLWPDMK